MAVCIKCPLCGQEYEIDDFMEGIEIECQKCSNVFRLENTDYTPGHKQAATSSYEISETGQQTTFQNASHSIPDALRIIRENPQIYPSVPFFKQRLKIDTTSCRRLLEELEKAGYISPILNEKTGEREIYWHLFPEGLNGPPIDTRSGWHTPITDHESSTNTGAHKVTTPDKPILCYYFNFFAWIGIFLALLKPIVSLILLVTSHKGRDLLAIYFVVAAVGFLLSLLMAIIFFGISQVLQYISDTSFYSRKQTELMLSIRDKIDRKISK